MKNDKPRIQPTSREQFINLLKAFEAKNDDPEIATLVKQFNAGDVMLTDFSITTAKNASDRQTIALFETTDEREVGITNIAKAMLPKGMFMLVSSVTLLGNMQSAGTEANPTLVERNSTAENQLLKTAKFYSLNANSSDSGQANLALVANGQLAIRVRTKEVLANLPVHRLVTDQNKTTPLGTYHLDCPIFIKPQEAIEAILELAVAAAPNTLLRLQLNGTATVPA